MKRGSPLEVLRVFLKLGMTSFGGPIAHLGYFREELVTRRRWLDERAFADLLALCQFLPGPASSQVAFALGLARAGWAGGAAAWLGFTTPSAAALVLFAYGAGALSGRLGTGVLHGLKLVAVAIVAQAVFGMARALCPDRQRAAIAVAGALIVLTGFSSLNQIGAILLGGAAGLLFCRHAEAAGEEWPSFNITKRVVSPASPRLGSYWSFRRSSCKSGPLQPSRSSTRSTARARSSSAAVTSSCRCCAVRSSRQAGSATTRSSRATARLKRCRVHCSPSRPISEPSRARCGESRAAPSRWSASFSPACWSWPARSPFGTCSAAAPGRKPPCAESTPPSSASSRLFDPVWTTAVKGQADFGVALTCFVLLMAWRAPPLVVVFVAALGGLLLGFVT